MKFSVQTIWHCCDIEIWSGHWAGKVQWVVSSCKKNLQMLTLRMNHQTSPHILTCEEKVTTTIWHLPYNGEISIHLFPLHLSDLTKFLYNTLMINWWCHFTFPFNVISPSSPVFFHISHSMSFHLSLQCPFTFPFSVFSPFPSVSFHISL